MTAPGRRFRDAVRSNGLFLFFIALFAAALVGQALSGVAAENAQRVAENLPEVSLAAYVTSSAFGVDVAENWQSEYLQFLLYIWATVWLVQRGSPESKEPGQEGRESDEEQKIGAFADTDSPRWARMRGVRSAVYGRSLGLVMGLIFGASWLAQSIAGRSAFDEERLEQLQDPVGWWGYVTSPEFWNRTFQNWQSEFLAVASMVALSIYLRQRGSPESKPVGSAHTDTGVEG